MKDPVIFLQVKFAGRADEVQSGVWQDDIVFVCESCRVGGDFYEYRLHTLGAIESIRVQRFANWGTAHDDGPVKEFTLDQADMKKISERRSNTPVKATPRA